MGHSMRFYISATLMELAKSKLETDQWRKSAWEKDMSNTLPPFNNSYHKAVKPYCRQHNRWEPLNLNGEKLATQSSSWHVTHSDKLNA